jgi:transcriptional regulator with XRE-family HTH domain
MIVATEERDESRARQRRLGGELRGLRDLAGLSGRDLARQLGISQSKVSRIEAGTTLPSLPEVKAWATAVGASVEVREWLIDTTEAAFTEVHPWRTALGVRTHLQDEVRERELRAKTSRVFQPSVVPGLLQTADYARRVFGMFQAKVYTDEGLAAAVAGRLHRQLALYEHGRRFEFLITEAALRWRPGPAATLLAQLDRIFSVSTLENVSIGLIPFTKPATVYTSHGFVIYAADEESDQGTIATVETIHAQLIIHSPDDVRLYEERWSMLRKMAVFDDEARAFLTMLGTEIRGMSG